MRAFLYLIGLDFHIQTDHKPLVPLFSTKALEQLPLRVQRFRLRMMRYRFTISHVPGKDLIVADMLSRAPTSAPACADQQFHHEGNVFINTVIQGLPASDQQLETIKAQQQQDEVCQQIKAYCEKGWPDRSAVPGSVKPYYPMLNKISVQGELLMCGSRIIIPASMRLSILDRIHTGH